MTEPEYVYVKGTGWVAKIYPSYSGTIGKYIVTVTQRPSKAGESWFSDRTSPDTVFWNLHRGWHNIFMERNPLLHIPKSSGSDYGVVISIEPVDSGT